MVLHEVRELLGGEDGQTHTTGFAFGKPGGVTVRFTLAKAVAVAGPACCCQMKVAVHPPASASMTRSRSVFDRFDPPTDLWRRCCRGPHLAGLKRAVGILHHDRWQQRMGRALRLLAGERFQPEGTDATCSAIGRS